MLAGTRNLRWVTWTFGRVTSIKGREHSCEMMMFYRKNVSPMLGKLRSRSFVLSRPRRATGYALIRIVEVGCEAYRLSGEVK
jgi:hypothetical protein